MNRQNLIVVTGFYLLVLASCKAPYTSTIVGDSYDEKTNQTTLTILPYGNIVLPDKWTKTRYDRVSKQHFFKNNDSTTVAVAKNPKDTYPFYKAGQSNKEYLAAFTKWESEYFKGQGATINIINDQSDKGYIIWKATIEKENISNTYLFGFKNDYAYNLSAYSRIWTNEKIQEFLIRLFNDN